MEAVCLRVYDTLPAITTVERVINNREGKIYLDYLQNVRGKTLAAPYSPRPIPGAPVSMPLEWSEVEKALIRPAQFTIANAAQRLKKTGDLFGPVLTEKHALPLLSAHR